MLVNHLLEKTAHSFLRGAKYDKAMGLLRGIAGRTAVSARMRATAQLEIGYLLTMQRRYEQALKELGKVEKLLSPGVDMPEVTLKRLYWSGYCYRQLGRYDEAIESYRKCYQAPYNPRAEKVFEITMMTARYEAALALIADGKLQAAYVILNELRQVGGNSHWTQIADRELANVRSKQKKE